MMNNISVSIENIHQKDPLKILKIYSYSPNLYLIEKEQVTLNPKGRTAFTFFIDACETGVYPFTVLIETDKGIFPYFFTASVVTNKIPYLEVGANPRFRSYNSTDPELFRITSSSTAPNISVIFDSTLFDREKSTITNVDATFHLRERLKIGRYTTFVYVLSPFGVTVSPITIEITEYKPVFPFDYFIFDTLMLNMDNISKKLTVFNPTSNEFNVTSARLDRTKGYLKLSLDTFIIKPHGMTDLGYINITTTKSHFGQSLTLNLNLLDLSTRKSSVLSTEVIAIVLRGGVETITESESEQFSSSVAHKLRNDFPFPLLLLGAYVESPNLAVYEFEQSIIPPGAESGLFFVSQKHEYVNMYESSNLVVITNATTFTVPVTKFVLSDIQVDMVTPDPSFCVKTGQNYTCNKVLTNTKKDFEVRLTNTNSLPFFLKSVNSTSGLKVTPLDPTFNPLIMPRMSVKLQLCVEFQRLEKPLEGNTTSDVIFFKGENGISGNMTFVYTPVNGTFKLGTSIKRDQTYGSSYEGDIRLLSDYDAELSIKKVTVNVPTQYMTSEHPQNLTRYTEYSIATLRIELDQSYKGTREFFAVIGSNSDFQSQFDMWDNLWPNTINYNFVITVQISNGYYFTKSIPMVIRAPIIHNPAFDFQMIHTDEIFVKKVTLSNYYNFPVEYTIHPIKRCANYTINYKRYFVIYPKQQFDFTVTFKGFKPGNYTLHIPVTTNISCPFNIPVFARTEYPMIRFVDKRKRMVTSIAFSGGEEELYTTDTWTKCVLILNTVQEPVQLQNMQLTENAFLRFSLNSSEIPVNGTASLCFDFYLWLFENETDTSDMQFSVAARNFVYNLPILVNLSKVTISHIYSSVDHTLDLITSMCTFGALSSCAMVLIGYCWFVKDVHWRKKRVTRAAKHYSVNNMKTCAVQKNDENAALATQWKECGYSAPTPATALSIERMEQFIH